MRQPASAFTRGSTAEDPPAAERTERLLRWVAVLSCAAAAAPFFFWAVREPAGLLEPRNLCWLVAFTAFIALFWLPYPPGAERCPTRGPVYLVVHAALAVILSWLVPVAVFAVFLVIVAAELGESLRPLAAAAGVLVMTLAIAPVFVTEMGWSDGAVLMGSFLGFQLFAVYAAHAAESERRARRELAVVNDELRSTRERLAEASREAERLRISRDLHDVLGHHLTALSLNLEAARHAEPAAVGRHVETAHGLARRLLGQVRRVVGHLRDDDTDSGDLAEALAALAMGIERPRLHVEVPEELRRLRDPERAAALLRCAQEIVTNAVRHSDADNLWIELAARDGGVELAGRDDGHGATAEPRTAIDSGHGLRGMRERIERLGGRLAIEPGGGLPAEGAGFRVTAWLPTP